MAAAKSPLCSFIRDFDIVLLIVYLWLSTMTVELACHDQLQARGVLENLSCAPPVFFSKQPF